MQQESPRRYTLPSAGLIGALVITDEAYGEVAGLRMIEHERTDGGCGLHDVPQPPRTNRGETALRKPSQ